MSEEQKQEQAEVTMILVKEETKKKEGEEEEEEEEEEDPHKHQHSAAAMSEEKLGDVLNSIEKSKFGKISAVSAFLRATSSCNFFTCQQVLSILEATTFEEERIDAIKVLSRKIVDPQNFHILYKKISTKGEKQAMSDAFSLSLEDIEAGIAAFQIGSEQPKKKPKKKKVPKPEKPKEEENEFPDKPLPKPTDQVVLVSREKKVSIYVTDPVKIGDGLGAHISYKISAVTSNQEYKTAGAGVRRRFNDIVWLHETLSFYHPGCIIPELPEKQMKGRFDPVFIEERRRVLERFINRCGSHPELCTSPALRIFLEATDDEWKDAQKQSKAELKADKKADKKEKSATFKGLEATKEMREYDSAYDKFITAKDYVVVAQDQLNAVKKQIKLIVAQEEAFADLTTKLGVLFQDVVPAETLYGNLGGALETVAKALANGVAKIHSLTAEVEKVQLLDPIREYLGLYEGIKEMMTNRLTALKNYQKAAAEVTQGAAKLSKAKEEHEKKMKGKGASDKDNAKMAEAQAAQAEREQAAEKRKQEFNTITETMFAELRRFHYEKALDFRDILLEYCKAKNDAALKEASVWKGLAEAKTIVNGLPERE